MKYFLPFFIFIALAGIFGLGLLNPRVQGTIDSPLIGKNLPTEIFPATLQKPAIVNFFSSWCTPCLIEHPHLMDLKAKGIKIYGVVFKDTQENIDDFIKKNGNPYEQIFHDTHNDIGITLGITGVPESFVVDAQGVIRLRHQGPLEDQVILKEIEDLLLQ